MSYRQIYIPHTVNREYTNGYDSHGISQTYLWSPPRAQDEINGGGKDMECLANLYGVTVALIYYPFQDFILKALTISFQKNTSSSNL